MGDTEDSLTQTERHVREAEGRAAHQVATVEVLDRDNHPATAALAREVLSTLRRSFELAREHLSLEREARGLTL